MVLSTPMQYFNFWLHMDFRDSQNKEILNPESKYICASKIQLKVDCYTFLKLTPSLSHDVGFDYVMTSLSFGVYQ